jgi:hypothetical protein
MVGDGLMLVAAGPRRAALGSAAQQRVAQLKQRIAAAGEAGVQLGLEPAEPPRGKVGIGMAAQPDSHTAHRQPELRKRPHRVKSQAKTVRRFL